MRVIAGRLKGRTFAAPRGLRTRPTTDRVREALFSILGEMSGKNVVDLYAGSGSLGIEALSRGAVQCTFVEGAKGAVKVLRDNLARLALEQQCSVLAVRVQRSYPLLLKRAPFDLVLCDPPWTDIRTATQALGTTLRPDLYSAQSTIVIGHPRAYDLAMPTATGLRFEEARTWGDAKLSFFTPEASPLADAT